MASILSIFKGGENRVLVPLYAFITLYLLPCLLMTGLIIIPLNKLSTARKQILSIPLLITTFVIPFGFTYENKMVEALSAANNSIFLRFLDLFWITPILQHKPAYTTFDKIWVEFWGCLRTFPEPEKKDTRELKKGQVKVFKKDRKFYHIIMNMVLVAVTIDILGSWIATFTINDTHIMRQERPIFYFFFFIACVTLLSSCFNAIGYALQLVYCLLFEQGSYSSEQWRPSIYNPIFSSTLKDLWSFRWHRWFKSTWIAFPFRPVYIMSDRFLTKRVKHSKSIAYALASMSVFLASGFMHEYMVACNIGWPLYKRFFIGEEMTFFVLQSLGIMIEYLVQATIGRKLPASFKNSMACKLIRLIWLASFGYFSFYYFVNGFLQWGFYLDNPLVFSQPYMVQFAKTHPPLMSFMGSLA